MSCTSPGRTVAPARSQRPTAYQAPHPEKPMAWMTVKTNWAPKMKKNAMKLKELSALKGTESQTVTAAGLRVPDELLHTAQCQGPCAARPCPGLQQGGRPGRAGRSCRAFLPPAELPWPHRPARQPSEGGPTCLQEGPWASQTLSLGPARHVLRSWGQASRGQWPQQRTQTGRSGDSPASTCDAGCTSVRRRTDARRGPRTPGPSAGAGRGTRCSVDRPEAWCTARARHTRPLRMTQ